MGQVLFWIPIRTEMTPDGVPIYGFGLMLFLAFILGNYLIGLRAARAGMPKEAIQDIALWIFLAGIVGARIVYMIQYPQQFPNPIIDFFQIWRGGIVFYGSAIGGTIGYLLARRFILNRFNLSTWKIGDVVAPSIAAGLCLGRMGCFLNGCCYGHIAAPDTIAVRFPLLTAPVRELLVSREALQTLPGFGLDDSATVGPVEPNSPAEHAGVRPGDQLLRANGRDIGSWLEFAQLLDRWPRGQSDLQLDVRREGNEVKLPPFAPRSLGIIPTQLFESVSMTLLFFVLITLYPIRQFDGQVFFVMMMGYAVHRFFNEMLRDDTAIVMLRMTLSQNISLVIFTLGAGLYGWRWSQPGRGFSPSEPGASATGPAVRR